MCITYFPYTGYHHIAHNIVHCAMAVNRFSSLAVPVTPICPDHHQENAKISDFGADKKRFAPGDISGSLLKDQWIKHTNMTQRNISDREWNSIHVVLVGQSVIVNQTLHNTKRGERTCARKGLFLDLILILWWTRYASSLYIQTCSSIYGRLPLFWQPIIKDLAWDLDDKSQYHMVEELRNLSTDSTKIN